MQVKKECDEFAAGLLYKVMKDPTFAPKARLNPFNPVSVTENLTQSIYYIHFAIQDSKNPEHKMTMQDFYKYIENMGLGDKLKSQQVATSSQDPKEKTDDLFNAEKNENDQKQKYHNVQQEVKQYQQSRVPESDLFYQDQEQKYQQSSRTNLETAQKTNDKQESKKDRYYVEDDERDNYDRNQWQFQNYKRETEQTQSRGRRDERDHWDQWNHEDQRDFRDNWDTIRTERRYDNWDQDDYEWDRRRERDQIDQYKTQTRDWREKRFEEDIRREKKIEKQKSPSNFQEEQPQFDQFSD